jgi:hypothetical protein
MSLTLLTLSVASYLPCAHRAALLGVPEHLDWKADVDSAPKEPPRTRGSQSNHIHPRDGKRHRVSRSRRDGLLRVGRSGVAITMPVRRPPPRAPRRQPLCAQGQEGTSRHVAGGQDTLPLHVGCGSARRPRPWSLGLSCRCTAGACVRLKGFLSRIVRQLIRSLAHA